MDAKEHQNISCELQHPRHQQQQNSSSLEHKWLSQQSSSSTSDHAANDQSALSWLEQSLSSQENSNYLTNLNQLLSTTNLVPSGASAYTSSYDSSGSSSSKSLIVGIQKTTATLGAFFDNCSGTTAGGGSGVAVGGGGNGSGNSAAMWNFIDFEDPAMSLTNHHHRGIDNELNEFVCDICSKGFSQKCLLKRHMKIHDKMEKCKCYFCSFETTFKFNLKSHMARKHNHICDAFCGH